jgi:UDP-glucose:(glucosyl)LPS alpha-1,2-glucosyltransferase
MNKPTIEIENENARGGTEILCRALAQRLDPDVLRHFQIIPARVRGFDSTRIPIYWLHDVPEGRESQHLLEGGWNKFQRIVYVSNWQAQRYQRHFDIPWAKGVVLLNAIDPIPVRTKARNTIRIIHHSTPDRGLAILVPVFEQLCRRYSNIELHVYSSFKLYGVEQYDAEYESLFQRCRQHPKMHYHGTQPNDVVRKALAESHIFAYPCIWPETSCLCLMEAMSAACLCVHSNFGALYETAASWTWMYQFQDDFVAHAQLLEATLAKAIDALWLDPVQARLATQKAYADEFYAWTPRVQQWDRFLRGVALERDIRL